MIIYLLASQEQGTKNESTYKVITRKFSNLEKSAGIFGSDLGPKECINMVPIRNIRMYSVP